MTNLLPTADFDGAWKYALEQCFPDFLALFFPDAYQAIDWNVPISCRTALKKMIGVSSGMVIFHSCCQREAPSTDAAS